MTAIVSAAYTSEGSIRVVDDAGNVHTVPDNVDNRHRSMLADWEDEGGVIAPYVEPPPLTEDEIEDQEIAAITPTLKKVLYQYANWIRELKGLPVWTQEQFLAWVKSL